MDGYLKRTEEGKRKISSGLPIALEHCPKVIQDLRNGVANNQRENKKKRSEKKSERVYIYIYTNCKESNNCTRKRVVGYKYRINYYYLEDIVNNIASCARIHQILHRFP